MVYKKGFNRHWAVASERQKLHVKRLIREFDRAYVAEGYRSQYEDMVIRVMYSELWLASHLLGFRALSALRKELGIPKNEKAEW